MSDALNKVLVNAVAAFEGRRQALLEGAARVGYTVDPAMTREGLPALAESIKAALRPSLMKESRDFGRTVMEYERGAMALAAARDHMLAAATPLQQAAAHGEYLAIGLAAGTDKRADGFLNASLAKAGATTST